MREAISLLMIILACGACLSDEEWISRNKGYPASCKSDDECFSGVCRAGQCAKALGEACDGPDECAGSGCLRWTKGSCGPGGSCDNGYACSTTGTCIGIHAICTRACTSDKHCFQGKCVTQDGKSFCRLPCDDIEDCSSAAVCSKFDSGRYCDPIKP